MKKNVGTVDRFIRIIMAAVIAILLYSNSVTGTVGLVLLTISAVLLLTSLASGWNLPLLRLLKVRRD